MSPLCSQPPQRATGQPTRPDAPAPVRPRDPRGFTLIELLVVISIIALLVGILMPALGKAREQAYMIKEMSAARQMALAQAVYAHENDGYFIRAKQNSTVPAYDEKGDVIPVGGPPPGAEIAQRYPFRLASYVNGALAGVIFVNEGEQFVTGGWQKQFEVGEPFAGFNISAYYASLFPSFGLNSYFVGGHDAPDSGSFDATWEEEQVLHRPQSSAVDTSGLIAFTSARGYTPGSPWSASDPVINEAPGYFYVKAPSHDGGWVADDFDRWNSPAGNWGQVDLRYNDTSITGFIDGHAEPMHLDELRDMQLWSHQAQRRGDANYTP